MAWFVPTDRRTHPCNKPTSDEAKQHRVGEWWRCEVCGDLWFWGDDGWDGPTLWERWRYRKQGWKAELDWRDIGPKEVPDA